MNHRANPAFWKLYGELARDIQRLADKNFQLLRQDSRHPSLHFKRVGRLWTVRIGLDHRAVAVRRGDEFVWFWIGSHADYDRLLD